MSSSPKLPPEVPGGDPLGMRPRPDALRHSVLRMATTGVLLSVVYAFVPVAANSVGATLLMFGGLALFVVLVVRQMQKIIEAEHPRLRAIEAFALVVPVLLFVFAYTYFSVSHAQPASFTEPLTRIDAIYFSTTIFGTVGFGDISATSEGARLIVTLQIVIGLGAAVGLARLLLGAANLGLRRRPAPVVAASPTDASSD